MSAWEAARAPTRTSVSRMIASLLGTRPEPTDDLETRADWLERKAEVFDRIAAVNQDDGDELRASEARAMAAEARTQAKALHADEAAERAP